MKINKRKIVSDLKLNESVLIDIDFDNLDSDLKTLSTDVKTLSTDLSSNVKSLSDDIDGLKDTIENLTFNGCSCDLEQLSTDILDEATKEIKDDISKNKISGDSQLEDTKSKSVALSSIDGKNCYTLHRFNGGCADAYLTQEAPYEYLDYNNFAISYFGENGDMLYDYAHNSQLLIRLNKDDSGDCELKYLSLESLTAILTNSIELTDIYDLLEYLSNEITAISDNTNIEEDITNILDLISYLSNEITAISSNTNIEEDITNILGLIDLLTDEITAITDIYDLIDYLSDELSIISSDLSNVLSDTWIKGGTFEENHGASIGDESGGIAIDLNDRELIGSWHQKYGQMIFIGNIDDSSTYIEGGCIDTNTLCCHNICDKSGNTVIDLNGTALSGNWLQTDGSMTFSNYESNTGFTQIDGGTVYAYSLDGEYITSNNEIRIGCTSINEEQLQKLLALLN